MEFRIADTFTDSLTKLTSQEQKAVKTTAFDLQLNPSSSGLRFHKLDRAKDPNFWSISVNYESTFATVRLRTDKTRGCVSQDSILSLVFKLVQSAQKRWLRIRGFKRLAEVMEGVKSKDGIRADQKDDSAIHQDAA